RCCSRSTTARCRRRSTSSFGYRASHGRPATSSPPSSGIPRASASTRELGHPEGIVVDTHVRRLSQRLGFTKQEDPVKIERDLVKLVPREDWARFPHLVISHAARVCIARRPLCEDCVVNDLCPSSRVDL